MVDYWVKITYKYETELSEDAAEYLMNHVVFETLNLHSASRQEILAFDLEKKIATFSVKLEPGKPILNIWSSCLVCAYGQAPGTKYCSQHQNSPVPNVKEIEDFRFKQAEVRLAQDTEFYNNLLSRNIAQYIPEKLHEEYTTEDEELEDIEFTLVSYSTHNGKE